MDDSAHVLGRMASEHRPENTLRSTRPDGAVVVGTPTASEPTAQPPAQPPRARRRRSRAVPVLVGVLAVLAAIAAVLVVRQIAGGEDDPPATSTGSNQQGAGENSGQGDQRDGGGGGSTSEDVEKEQMVRDYYSVAPGGTDEAWAMLGPSMQEQGRDRYDAFWRTVDSVDVRSADARPGSDSVDVTLVYHTSDGRTSTERKVEGLVKSDDGGYLIDSDEPAA